MISRHDVSRVLTIEETVEALPEARPSRVPGFILLSCMALFVGLALWSEKSPGSASGVVPPTEFSAERAMSHVQAIAQTARPIGSAAHEEARAYIMKALAAEGLEPQVQETTNLGNRRRRILFAGTVHNIIARLKGQNSTKAVLLSAHYDSVPNSSGASDDATAVGALIETARALRS